MMMMMMMMMMIVAYRHATAKRKNEELENQCITVASSLVSDSL